MNCEAPAITSTLIAEDLRQRPAGLARRARRRSCRTARPRSGTAGCRARPARRRGGSNGRASALSPAAGAGLSCRPMALQPAIPGLILAGGAGAPDGRRRQGAAAARRPAAPRPRHRSPGAAGRPAGAQRQRRPGALRGLRPAGARRRRAGGRGSARGPARRPRLGGDARRRGARHRRRRHAVPAARPRRPPARRRRPGAASPSPRRRAGPARSAHPTAGLWPVGLRATLRADLAAGERRLGGLGRGAGAAPWRASPTRTPSSTSTRRPISPAPRRCSQPEVDAAERCSPRHAQNERGSGGCVRGGWYVRWPRAGRSLEGLMARAGSCLDHGVTAGVAFPDGARGLTECVVADFVATEKLQENYGKPTPMSSG